MEIADTGSYIRQQQIGQFRRPEDSKGPFAHINGEKIESPDEKKRSSIYIDNENAVTFKKDIRSSLPKFFDPDAGVKFNTDASIDTNKTNKNQTLDPQYDKTGKAGIMNKHEGLVDQWA